MKKTTVLLVVILGLLSIVKANAQTSVTSSGMSIQGIARDVNNEALSNIEQLGLGFTVYYFIGNSTTPTVILTATANVKTDNFGVFSYVLNINQDQYNLISNQSAYLKVSSGGSVVFSDEKLQTVPYAIFAQNGVPTGSVMPFIGTVAPNGWLLCDGTAIPSGAFYDNLKTLAGANTPDLRGMFLRGTGSTSTGGRTGPALKVVQQDDILSHRHDLGTSATVSSNGSHSHETGFANDDHRNYGSGNNENGLVRDLNGDNNRTLPTNSTGSHNHNIGGSTNYYGLATETRPINYGINYIIKI